MEIKKPNDIFVATINSPNATTYDLMSNGFNGENTSLFDKDEYKNTSFVQKTFTDTSGKFDEAAFDNAYNIAQQNYYNLTNEQYLKDLDTIKYSPFDITRPKNAKTFEVDATIEKEYNPFKLLYGWTGIGSINENSLSLRELAQQNKVFDPETNTWTEETAHQLSLLDKLFGETLVYAQWDDDGTHNDSETGRLIEHKKGDWKYDDGGNLYTEKLAGREVYGKQVVNPMDILTVEGTTLDKFNFLDSDDREKSMVGTVFKTAFEIAPYFIPSFGVMKGALAVRSLYGGLNAGIGLAATLPTFYKAIEGFLLGDENTLLTKGATNLEGWMSKFATSSTSDRGQSSAFSFEQVASMVGSIFSQIHEQRAMASLSKYFVRADEQYLKKGTELGNKINQELLENALEGKININDIGDLSKAAMSKIPELQSMIKSQSQLSKALSLGYMALTSTGEIYGEAIEGGYDRRTAGFAALAAATGQYALMMNNRMGDWFLDKTTGYTTETNTALLRQSVMPHLAKTKEAVKLLQAGKTSEGKKALGGIFKSIRTGINNIFTSPSSLKEAMWKNSIVEGVEEVTEQAVLDMTKGVVDVMSYLGLTSKQGTFGGFENAFSKQGFENYLANFVGGILGGGMFEFHRQKIEPLFSPESLSLDTKKGFYEYIAEGKKDALIKIINQERKNLGNSYLTPLNTDGTFQEVGDNKISQADLIADNLIGMVELVDGILNSHDLIQTDEEIIKKTIRDEIIIKNLKQTAAEGSSIGIEGLVLEDIKNKKNELVDLELQLKKIPEAEKDSQHAKILKGKIKDASNYINDILEGKQGGEYFRKAILFMNKKINKSFLKIDKAEFTKENYGVDFTDLPETGEGITQETVNKAWNDHLDSKDLRKDLNMADKVYLKWEQLLNKPIEEYVNTGYSEEHRKTLTNLQDIRKTIELFNVETDPVKKEKIFKNYIEINNSLAKQGEMLTGPWTVLHDNIYDEFKNLGLIKKVSYSEDESGGLNESYSDFTEEELNELNEDSDTTIDQRYRELIKAFFQNYPSNPVSIESVINDFNEGIKQHNITVSKKIREVSQEEDSEEKEEKLNSLQKQLLNVSVLNLNQTNAVAELLEEHDILIHNTIDTSGLTQEDVEKYTRIKDTYDRKLNYNTFLNSFGLTDIKDANNETLNLTIDKLIELGIYTEVLDKLSKVSSDANVEIQKAINKLNDSSITEEELNDVKKVLSPFFGHVENILNKNYEIVNDNSYDKLNKELELIQQKLNLKIEEAKPDLFKMKNRALYLAINELKNGNADKEAFLFAEDLFNQEKARFLSSLFPKLSNLDYNETIAFIENIPSILRLTNERLLEDETLEEDVPFDRDTLTNLISAEEATIKDGNYSGIFNDLNSLNFIKKYFDLSMTGSVFWETLRNAVKSYNVNKHLKTLLDNFLDITSKGITLKSNPLYDFIRNLAVTLNSNPNNKVAKIFDILKKEETLLRSTSNIINYGSDAFREQDLDQALDIIAMIKSVVYAMSTTVVDYEDPIGFISVRQQYAKKYNIEDDVLNLVTISSDMASLMNSDLELIESKLRFYKEFGSYNASKSAVEQELIRGSVEQILLSKWTDFLKNLNPKFYPTERIKSILDSKETSSKKLMLIESEIFLHNINQKHEALEELLLHLPNVNHSKIIPINREVKNLSDWDLATYFATTLAFDSKDFYIRSLISVNGKFTKAPFFTQEFASKIVKATTVNPELFSKIYQIKQNSKYVDISFITTILGNAGTGKTAAVLGLTLEHFKQTNDLTNIWVSAPSDLQTNNLETAIIDSTGSDKLELVKYTKNDLFDKLGLKELVNQIAEEVKNIDNTNYPKTYVELSKEGFITFTDEFNNQSWLDKVDLSQLPNLLVIDEVTHYSFFELKILNDISKLSFENNSSNFMKIIGAGDTSQLGYLAKVGGRYFSYNIESMNSIFMPKLWSSIRSTNVQSKMNGEIIERLSSSISSIYNENSTDPNLASSLSNQFLEQSNAAKLNLLSYYENNEDLFGAKIVSSLTTQLLKPIINNIKLNPNKLIGILTEDASDISELSEDILKVLTDSGLIKPDGTHPNIRLFTVDNIQGSEVDYFIFDTNLTTRYDKIRDNIKAFYTYMTRSKDATIIIDSEDVLKNKYKIYQGAMDKIPQKFEPLTPTVIKKIKEDKKEHYISLVGENSKPSNHDNFKWKVGASNSFEIETSRFVGSNIPPGLPEKSDNVLGSEKEALKDNFKLMMYSFYNNPGVDLELLKNNIIKVDRNKPNTDLNGIEDLSEEAAKAFIEDWSKLKYKLLYNTNISNIITTDFQNYFNNIFSNLEGAESIEIEFVITASKMDRAINTPYKKKYFESSEVLENGTPFINLSAKLKWGDSVHYITLATLGSKAKILSKAKEYNVSEDDINKVFKNITKDLKTNPFVTYELNTDYLSFLTSTILWSPKKKGKDIDNVEKYTLDTLAEEFPGLNFSEIRFIPHTRKLFKELFNKHVFGDPRDMEIIVNGDGKEVFKDVELEKRFINMRNKPYVSVSYDNDINGDETSNTTKSRIVMIGSNKRDFNTITKEVEEILLERKEELSANIKNNKADKISLELNAKTETLLNRNDILEILIKWGTTFTNSTSNPNETYLDLLFTELPFKLTDTIAGKKTSVFEIFTRFNNTGKQITSENLKKVINLVKTSIVKNSGDSTKIKKDVISSIEKTAFWHWSFFNIFGYKSIITSFSDNEFTQLLTDGMLDEENFELFNKDASKQLMERTIERLLSVIKDMEFYYSIPVKPGILGTIVANPVISGENGFSKNYYADKFYINVAPESSRIMFDLKGFLDMQRISSEQTSKKVVTKISTEPQPPGNFPAETETETETGTRTETETSLELVLKTIDNLFDHEEMAEVHTLIVDILQANSSLQETITISVGMLLAEESRNTTNIKPTYNYRFRKIMENIGITFNENDKTSAQNVAVALNLSRDTQKEAIKDIARKINNLTKKEC